ncbi:MAG: hypothetical protein ACI8Q1_002046 [Parvicella sp.]|jgi:hypothetical protein
MNKRTISKLGLATMAVATLSMTSCKKGCTDPDAINYDESAKKDNESCEYEVIVTGNEVVSGTINTNTTWTSDKVYELQGKVVVDNGAILTIQAGTIIKGQEGTGTNASALIVARGSKIAANGTAAAPIIFTSILDNITIGQTSGTNLTETDNGKWGGIIVLGYAPISAGDGDTESQIEGIPATETYGAFGGANATDNSGTINYVSIRHGGALIGAGNEINGLTLGGVGSGTVISNVEVMANLDDGIEFFGGTVDITNAVVAFQGDDGIDIDMNYSGSVTNFAVVHGGSTDEALEIDGPEGITHTTGLFSLSNGTIKSTDGVGTGGDFKSKAQGTITNVSFEGYGSKILKIRASFSDTLNCTDKTDSYVHLTQASPTLNITNSQFVSTMTMADVIDIYTGSVQISTNDVCTNSLEATAENAITTTGSTVVSSATTGADLTQFAWTWTAQNGKL